MHSLSQTLDPSGVHPSYLERLSLDTKESEEGTVMLLPLHYVLQKILFRTVIT